MLGAYTDGDLRHYGYAGSGFSEKGLKDAVEKMKPLLTNKCPFVNPPNLKEKIQWVRPKLVCEVEYAELTADDIFARGDLFEYEVAFGICPRQPDIFLKPRIRRAFSRTTSPTASSPSSA